jgi:hypothetical protein
LCKDVLVRLGESEKEMILSLCFSCPSDTAIGVDDFRFSLRLSFGVGE